MSTYNSDGHLLTLASYAKETYIPDKYGLCKTRACTEFEGMDIAEVGNYNITYKDKDFLGRPKQATATLIESGDFHSLPSKIDYTLKDGKIQEVVEYYDDRDVTYKHTITYEKFDIK